MSQERKTYPKEFKLMSVELSNTRTDLSALAKELDISPAMLYRCGKVILSAAEQELSLLKKELRETQMEHGILNYLDTGYTGGCGTSQKRLSAFSARETTNIRVHKGSLQNIFSCEDVFSIKSE
ncbi:transposase [Sphingobacterium sp. ML3W]|uniref:transposase n=1 Tax=Sphingobacterium sp. ML3W TaxID=1538644 RepID=UPI0006920579|nr:transposase [Sphingobacterium sp. ML3W]